MSRYTFRLRAPKGLESTLIKEVSSLGLGPESKAKRIPGRKAIEVTGPLDVMWNLVFKSRIVEDVQVKMTTRFLARGEDELKKNLDKLPWPAYLDLENHKDFATP